MALTLPVLPLTDGVLLPGMVVPVELDSEAQAAVDAARTAGSAAGGIRSEARVLVVPRLDGKYAAVGTVAILDQVGRLPTGEPGALLRGTTRARVGHGVTGPGAALWVVPNPSGLNAHHTVATLAEAYAEPARAAGLL